MKPFFFILVTGVLLSSCAPKTQAVTEPQIAKLEKGETLIINTTLNLFTFPRSVIYLIDSVFNNYHYQLTGNGWTQETLRKRDKAYEARYSRQGQRLTVRLRLEADRYILQTS